MRDCCPSALLNPSVKLVVICSVVLFVLPSHTQNGFLSISMYSQSTSSKNSRRIDLLQSGFFCSHPRIALVALSRIDRFGLVPKQQTKSVSF
jgi:hypothetical protein